MAYILSSQRVVDAPGLTIDEHVGNVASKNDDISIAAVSAAAGTSEPWLTLHYEEWMHVTSGELVINQEGKEPLTVSANQTVHLPSGTRFRPTFPKDVTYIPVCTPAFRPDRCIREDTDEEGKMISANLKELHSSKKPPPEAPPEVLYHMLPLKTWEAAKEKNVAYFPSTFEEDDHLTHATGVPSRLVDTANHYYQDTPGDWVCLTFTRSALRKRGIFVRDEHATAVGNISTSPELMAGAQQ